MNNHLQKTKLTAIILATDQNTCMNSSLSKYLHPVAGIPIILRVVRALQGLSHQEEFAIDLDIHIITKKNTYQQIKEISSPHHVIAESREGIVDTVELILNKENDHKTVMLFSADYPLVQTDHFISVLKDFQKAHKGLAKVTSKIQGHKNIEFGYVFDKIIFDEMLSCKIQPSSAHLKDGFKITDLISLFLQKKKERVFNITIHEDALYRVNSQQELAKATKRALQRKNEQLMDKGVIIIDPDNTYIEDDVDIQSASVIYPHTHIMGSSQIAQDCVIEPHCMIRDSKMNRDVKIKAGSYLEDVVIDSHTSIGPYARLRPQTRIGRHCKIGNFVEIKKSTLAENVKASHLTYLGDAQVGSHTNIGCGTITCNYREDHKKYKTVIEDHVFVGSDVQLVAPIKIGQGSIIGSGSTITKEVPPNSLTVARAKQIIKANWKASK